MPWLHAAEGSKAVWGLEDDEEAELTASADTFSRYTDGFSVDEQLPVRGLHLDLVDLVERQIVSVVHPVRNAHTSSL